MKIAAFMGSPRKNKNTDVMLDAFLKGVRENSNEDIKNIFLQRYKISNCLACDSCNNTHKCVVNDDMQNIYPVFEEADIVVFATPIYWWSMSAQMKSFIDRLYAVGSAGMKGKKAYVLMTYGGELPNSGPELVQKTFEYAYKALYIRVLYKIVKNSSKIRSKKIRSFEVTQMHCLTFHL